MKKNEERERGKLAAERFEEGGEEEKGDGGRVEEIKSLARGRKERKGGVEKSAEESSKPAGRIKRRQRRAKGR